MAKPKITRTYGPIHFEDLDPHRFEDLIRELIYDFKDWQSIEATGRSGSDEGFDIRAYEKVEVISRVDDEIDEETKEVHPMEGNPWMIQVKREQAIGPQKIKSILSDIDSKNPPYGYILAASSNFSKESHDVFREELRNKGVMEFYLWGKAELEDMLYLPKNDRILFTFFGISLASKRRKRETETRSAISVKNKLFRIVGEGSRFRKSILIRDLKDTKYPYKNEYSDFKAKPRWKEYVAFGHHPLGLKCHVHKYFAYVDTEKKEWDFAMEADLVYREREDKDERQEALKKRSLVNDFWDFLPGKNKGHFVIDCIVKYTDIAIVDEKGDVYYNFPHIYVDFVGKMGPFAACRKILEINNKEIELTDDYKRINIFPKKYKKAELGKIYKKKKIDLSPESQKEFKEYQLDTLYETDGKYNFLNSRDVIQINDKEAKAEEVFIQITYKFKEKAKVYIEQSPEPWRTKRSIELQLGRTPADDEGMNIYEFKRIYKWEIDKKQR
ncbi:MAG: restriction endonuclease [Promethearchaeota archaeon]